MNQLPNLLIVDDTETNLVLLEAVTKEMELNLIKANGAIEALEKTRGVELALAIIDVRMPIIDGFELARKLNECRSDSKVPIIFLTANYDRDAVEGYDSGAVDYLYKPLHSRILQSKINVFLDLFNQKQKIIRNTELLKESSDELKSRWNNYTIWQNTPKKQRNTNENRLRGNCMMIWGRLLLL